MQNVTREVQVVKALVLSDSAGCDRLGARFGEPRDDSVGPPLLLGDASSGHVGAATGPRVEDASLVETAAWATNGSLPGLGGDADI